MKTIAKILPLASLMCAFGNLHATGYYGPTLYLDDGGKNVDASPEFYWGLEVRRLAREFRPAEKLVVPENSTPKSDEEETPDSGGQDTEDADLKDFAAALKEGRIKPADSAKALQQHHDVRTALHHFANGTKMPDEFAGEFADYDRGAFAFRGGKEHWDEARAAWEDLLKRPEQDRHYRSVWAAFMLGKLALKVGDYPAATKWFQRTRELAAGGFADSLGMAADSYGWEGRSEWKQQHPEKAAVLFLTQLALGDASAVVSLKALVPDREPTEGMLNYGPESEERNKWNDQQKREEEQKAVSKLKAAAQDPWLRRLVTVHILATASSPDLESPEANNAPVNRCARWLEIIRQANLNHIEDAEYLGWTAYNNGDYKGAAHWLELSKGDTTAAFWLRAKLQRRAGKLADAANSMAQAFAALQNAPAYTPQEGPIESTEYDSLPEGDHWGFGQSASGDLGGLRLARGDFVQALDTLMQGHLWNDAAFVAEQVLTANELKEYVDRQPKTDPPKEGEDYPAKLRYLLGRRLVREDRYDEAAAYLAPPYDKVLQRYAAALKEGNNEKLTKLERARAWFAAAWLARVDGMELMGTEVAPDVFSESGQFEISDLAKQRRTGFYEKISYSKDGEQKKTKVPIALKPSKQELQRLAANKINPDLRFHYRIIAGALALKAAALLPNNSEELADVVNRAGLWVKDRDEKEANKYFKIIEQRCPNTKIGHSAAVKHWFVDETGPWSEEQQTATDALHKELGIEQNN